MSSTSVPVALAILSKLCADWTYDQPAFVESLIEGSKTKMGIPINTTARHAELLDCLVSCLPNPTPNEKPAYALSLKLLAGKPSILYFSSNSAQDQSLCGIQKMLTELLNITKTGPSLLPGHLLSSSDPTAVHARKRYTNLLLEAQWPQMQRDFERHSETCLKVLNRCRRRRTVLVIRSVKNLPADIAVETFVAAAMKVYMLSKTAFLMDPTEDNMQEYATNMAPLLKTISKITKDDAVAMQSLTEFSRSLDGCASFDIVQYIDQLLDPFCRIAKLLFLLSRRSVITSLASLSVEASPVKPPPPQFISVPTQSEILDFLQDAYHRFPEVNNAHQVPDEDERAQLFEKRAQMICDGLFAQALSNTTSGQEPLLRLEAHCDSVLLHHHYTSEDIYDLYISSNQPPCLHCELYLYAINKDSQAKKFSFRYWTRRENAKYWDRDSIVACLSPELPGLQSCQNKDHGQDDEGNAIQNSVLDVVRKYVATILGTDVAEQCWSLQKAEIDRSDKELLQPSEEYIVALEDNSTVPEISWSIQNAEIDRFERELLEPCEEYLAIFWMTESWKEEIDRFEMELLEPDEEYLVQIQRTLIKLATEHIQGCWKDEISRFHQEILQPEQVYLAQFRKILESEATGQCWKDEIDRFEKELLAPSEEYLAEFQKELNSWTTVVRPGRKAGRRICRRHSQAIL